MIRRNQRFRNQLDDHLVHLHKNLFISHADPLYHEKVIRYLDANSPEAHFNLGQKFREKGNWKRARFHYKEVLKTYPSPFYSAANRAIQLLDQQQATHVANLEQTLPAKQKPLLPPFMKMLLLVLLILNVLLVLFFAGNQAIPRTISQMKLWSAGTQVTYESVDKPFILYLSPEMSHAEIEKKLHAQALVLAKEIPKATILLYGIVTEDNRDKGKTLLLTKEDDIKRAMVIATYQPEADALVHIRFLNAEFEEHQPLSAIGANLVRTALASYRENVGQAPARIDELLQDYPLNYLSFIPIEAVSGSNEIKSAYKGDGGWVFNPKAADIAHMFYANVAGGEKVPYEPVHLEVNQRAYQLQLVSGSHLLWDKDIGLGANGSTPDGVYRVLERVQQPKGKTSQSYGDAGLGLGSIALHGTYDESSIGESKSLGCIRLTNDDIQQLFPFVPKGAEVRILSSEHTSNPNGQVSQMSKLIPTSMPQHSESAGNIIFHWLG
ncbi:L,D-transpeptidase family protein [Paenibacillus qinlingensis]|uniref:L,D-transpeptidase family protein n=1 Tax=Paenibacillus qinlingensis TaxID=1837343 RepID=UPI0015637E8E|nr:L,D-transpeptidase family protein [Paenibacillus qinlingensis]NQX58530.1 L,D-transpeptidase family protein [Paenibacillus qinlingensis]